MMQQHKPDTVLVIIAMAAEAAPCIDALDLKPKENVFDRRLPMKAYCGHRGKIELMLAVNGIDPRFGVDQVATQPAAVSAYAAIERFNPDMVINAGTAGGFKSAGLDIGEAVISGERLKFHDRRIPLAGFDEYGIGSYPCADMADMAKTLGLKTTGISTGNSLDMTPMDLEMIEKNHAAIKEMEAAAVAWVAWTMEKPFMALKAVSDFLDSPEKSETQFTKNLAKATQNLSRGLVGVIDYLGKEGT